MKTNSFSFFRTLHFSLIGSMFIPLTLVPAAEDDITDLQPMLVIAHPVDCPLRLTIDPRGPAQPIPAQDGAEALRAIPGFNIIRKGGTDGDPVLRGMAGSRLGILLNGESILGGCGNRMDPPTAYVFPSAYEQVTVIKGPQTVLYGSGHSAGVVLFESAERHFGNSGFVFDGSFTLGSFGRNDQLLDLDAFGRHGYLKVVGTRTAAGDYRDGSGRRIHSRYERWSAHATAGWTPDAHTQVELSGILSDGEAAYADRGMDGTRFARQNIGLRIRRQLSGKTIESIDAQVFYNYVDHA